jgi:hypothetical protein
VVVDQILYCGDAVEDNIDSTLPNLVALTIPNWRTFNLLRISLLLVRLIDLDKNLNGDDVFECDFDFVLLNPIASTIPKRRTFRLLR